MSISAIDGTCAFLCRSVGARRYWKAKGSDPCGVGWVILVSSSSRHQFATIPFVISIWFCFRRFRRLQLSGFAGSGCLHQTLGGRVIFS